jgi:hypothetical protein
MEEIGFNPAWEAPLPNGEILSILHQPFTYLARGNQSTVFVSQDGQYVLKIFRYTRSRFSLLQTLSCWTAKLKNNRPKRGLCAKMNKTLNATYLAATTAQKCTQVIFCHLNLSQGKLPVVECQAGRVYYVPLDQCRFALQKKVNPFDKTLIAARERPEEMHRLIDSFISLLRARASLGIRNSDPNLRPNFGFLGFDAVEIDFGNYERASPRAGDMSNYLKRLEDWLKKNAPEYVEYLHRKGAIAYDSADAAAK